MLTAQHALYKLVHDVWARGSAVKAHHRRRQHLQREPGQQVLVRRFVISNKPRCAVCLLQDLHLTLLSSQVCP
jgi:hypothetical protein